MSPGLVDAAIALAVIAGCAVIAFRADQDRWPWE